jgi:KaiC/GvpD/RAD55 family RecA-like ATPase
MANRFGAAPSGESDEVQAEETAFAQVDRAVAEIYRDPRDYLALPWPSVHDLVGGVAPGTLGFLVGFSGNGKTSLLMSLTDLLLQENKTVYYVGLESAPDIIRTHLACLRLNLHPGDVLSGKLKTGDPDWPKYRLALLAELEKQKFQREHNRLLCSDEAHVDLTGLADVAADAARANADLLIVDHIDHVGGEASYEENVAAVRLLLSLALKHRLRVLAASQLNQSVTQGDRLAQFRPPSPGAVKMGGHKREVAHYMLAVYRPIRKDATADDLRAVREDRADVSHLLAPRTMGVACLKNRFYGDREGRRCRLHIQAGQVREKTSLDDSMDRIRQKEEVPF